MTKHVFEETTIVPATLDEVFPFFAAPENLGRITPPKMGFKILSGPSHPIREGDRIEYQIRIFGVPMRWRTLITSWKENESFADYQEKGPYKLWHHTHTFRAVPEGVEMHDRVEYELPFGMLGDLLGHWLVKREVAAIFKYRGEVIRTMFARR